MKRGTIKFSNELCPFWVFIIDILIVISWANLTQWATCVFQLNAWYIFNWPFPDDCFMADQYRLTVATGSDPSIELFYFTTQTAYVSMDITTINDWNTAIMVDLDLSTSASVSSSCYQSGIYICTFSQNL